MAEFPWHFADLDLEPIKARRETFDNTLNDIDYLLAEVERLREQRERRRVELVAYANDALNIRGILSPNGYPRRVPMELGPELAPVVEWMIDQIEWQRGEMHKLGVERYKLTAQLAGYEPERVDAVPGRPLPAGVEGHDPHQWTDEAVAR